MDFDINDFRTDSKLEKDGVWVDFGGGASFKIASLENRDFTEAFRKASKPYTDLGREISLDQQEEILSDLLARYIVIEWKGVFDSGKEFPYSVDNAVRLMTEISKVREWVLLQSKNLQNFKTKEGKKTEKN